MRKPASAHKVFNRRAGVAGSLASARRCSLTSSSVMEWTSFQEGMRACVATMTGPAWIIADQEQSQERRFPLFVPKSSRLIFSKAQRAASARLGGTGPWYSLLDDAASAGELS